jgi:molecular chaperone GrpE
VKERKGPTPSTAEEPVPEVDLDEAAAGATGDEPAPAGGEPLPDEGGLSDDTDLPTALAQRDEYLALARRVQADFENFRKRALKQQSEQAAAANARLVESLLPVLDACDSAVIHGIDGVGPIHKSLLDILTKAGLEVVADEGAPFDPTVHEEVLRTGYLWNGRTLRAAMVKVRD